MSALPNAAMRLYNVLGPEDRVGILIGFGRPCSPRPFKELRVTPDERQRCKWPSQGISASAVHRGHVAVSGEGT